MAPKKRCEFKTDRLEMFHGRRRLHVRRWGFRGMEDPKTPDREIIFSFKRLWILLSHSDGFQVILCRSFRPSSRLAMTSVLSVAGVASISSETTWLRFYWFS